MRIVAVGDSVMWGQGLLTEQKFAHLVAAELGEEIAEGDFLAHSGAIIGPARNANQDVVFSVSDGVRDPIARGEIPGSRPTVHEQLSLIEDPEGVELLLINGGPNDLKGGFVGTLLNPLLTFGQLERRFKPALGRSIGLIRAARSTCPTAVIVYTGYYCGLSRETDPAILPDALQLGLWLARKLSVLGDIAADRLIESIIRSNLYFAHGQLRWLRTAVAQAMDDPGLRGPGILFAHPRFTPENAVGASSGDAWVRWFVSRAHNDPQLDARMRSCPIQYPPAGLSLDLEEFAQLPWKAAAAHIDLWTCLEAGTFHPNAECALRGYQPAVLEVLRSNQAVSVDEIVTDLAPQTRSLRRGLERYGLHRRKDGTERAALSVRSLNQHRVVDLITVQVLTGRSPRGNEGTDDAMIFDVGTRGWLLTRKEGRGDSFNADNEFGASPLGHTFHIDTAFDLAAGAQEGTPLRLRHVQHLRLTKEPKGLVRLFPDYFLGNLRVTINGDVAVYDPARGTGSKHGIKAWMTGDDPMWTSGEAGELATSEYPEPE